VPRGVDLLVLDRVLPGRGLQARLADGDRVGLDALEVLVEHQLVGPAVDRHDRRILLGEVLRVDLGVPRRHADRDLAVALGQPQRFLDVLLQPAGLHLASLLGLQAPEHAGRDVDLRVARLAVQLALDARDQPVHSGLRVGGRDRDLGFHLAAGEVAGGADQDVAVAAPLERLVDHPLRVDPDLGGAGAQLEALVVVGGPERAAQPGVQLALHLLARPVGAHAADVDAAGLDALRDQVVTRGVVRVDGDRAEDEDCQRHRKSYEGSLPHCGLMILRPS
jgi:hypothetical protein